MNGKKWRNVNLCQANGGPGTATLVLNQVEQVVAGAESWLDIGY